MAEDGHGQEQYFRQVGRHLRNPLNLLNPDLIAKGVKGAYQEINRGRVLGSQVSEVPVIADDKYGVRGLSEYIYSIAPKGENRANLHQNISCMVLPSKASIEARFSSKIEYESAFLVQSPDLLGSMVGPTEDKRELPNNGFYSRKGEGYIPFTETNPPGQRRGAIAIDTEGKVKFITDQDKFRVVDSKFSGIETMIGTSFFFNSDDNPNNRDLFSVKDYTSAAYLVQYKIQGEDRYAFIYPNEKVSRYHIKNVVDNTARELGAEKYMAMELELFGGNLAIRGTDGIHNTIRRENHPRKLHLVVKN